MAQDRQRDRGGSGRHSALKGIERWDGKERATRRDAPVAGLESFSGTL